jgi:hypothetical protein
MLSHCKYVYAGSYVKTHSKSYVYASTSWLASHCYCCGHIVMTVIELAVIVYLIAVFLLMIYALWN